MEELLNDFLAETNEGLLVVEQQMLQLEKEPENKGLVHDIFRVLHTIKGTCGFLGLTRLQNITHSSENLFGKIRDGFVDLDADTLAILFEAIDKIKLIVKNLRTGIPEDSGEVDEILQLRLDACSRKKKSIKEPDFAIEDALAHNSQEVIDTIFENIAKVSSETIETKIEDVIPDVSAIVTLYDNQKITNDDSAIRIAPDINQSVRVNIAVLDNIINLTSELILLRNQLLERFQNSKNSDLKTMLTRLNFVTSELNEEVMKTRMQPIEVIWSNFPRIVRDLAQQLGKKINLQMIGNDTEVDRQILALIKDPIMHMLYNSIDHGIEMPAARIAANKPEEGLIVLKAYHESGSVIIEILDDGKGIDIEKVKNLVIEQQLATQLDIESMTADQIINFIFHPGFSTAKTITNFSGRGVGMDVVKVNVEKLGGMISAKHTHNMQTVFTIKVPITLTIFPALIFSSGGINFAVLQSSVVKLVKINDSEEKVIEYSNSFPVLRLGNNLLPLIMLNNFLHESLNDFEQFVICLEVDGFKFGLVVEKVFDVQEIFVKSLAKILKNTQFFNGVSILDNGAIAIVLDMASLAKSVFGDIDLRNNFLNQGDFENSQVLPKNTALLRFKAEQSWQVIPFFAVQQVIDIKISELSQTEGQYFYSYNNQSIPLMVAQGMQPLESYASEKTPLIVLTNQKSKIGIIVSEIVDMIETDLHIDISSRDNGILGECLIENIATSIVDVNYYFEKPYYYRFMS